MADAWDGRPERPERDGWHWIMTTGGKTHACFWYANLWTTPVGDGALSPEDVSNWRYLGPCLTPAEVAAAVQAEREACLRLIDQHQSVAREVIGRNPENREAVGGVWATAECASAIRARGDTSALDAALAQARREGMEAAARIVDARFSTMPGIAAAIRSAAGEDGQ